MLPNLELKMTEEATTERPMYVHKSTGFIYEAQIFDKFVMIRMATPGLQSVIKKLSLGNFSDEFAEYEGDPEAIRQILRGERLAPYLVVTKGRENG